MFVKILKIRKMKCLNDLSDTVAILVSKKRCIFTDKGILLKKGVSKKNAIIKLRGQVIPKEINSKLYNSYFVDKSVVKHIPYYKQISKNILK